MVFLYLFILLFSCVSGFLFEGKTQSLISTTNSPLSDDHFDMLLKLLVEQRQIQKEQHQMIKQLQEEIFTTKLEVTKAIHDLNKTSCNETRYDDVWNFTKSVETKIDTLNVSQIRQINTLEDNSNKIKVLEHKIAASNHMQSSINLQSFSNVLNTTKHLESGIQETNYKLAAIENDANARKNDFIALFNKADLTEKKMENMSQDLEQKWNDLNDRVIVIVYAEERTYTGGQVVIFNDVNMAYGFGNLYTLTTSGQFICEKSGVYQLAVYITTTDPNASLNIYKNKLFLGAAYGSITQYFQTLNFASFFQLKVNDTLKVTFGGGLVIGKPRSALSIIQIK